ncbi:hypothetical protein B0J18DRAFT_158597 [Chaetomium sp. MPI-SDFR-AT-0129]|nr:hypothetical protein B0J18DRAFT_158597 [Chaetomium sp. MPI-SDFR-AT-0129]
MRCFIWRSCLAQARCLSLPDGHRWGLCSGGYGRYLSGHFLWALRMVVLYLLSTRRFPSTRGDEARTDARLRRVMCYGLR